MKAKKGPRKRTKPASPATKQPVKKKAPAKSKKKVAKGGKPLAVKQRVNSAHARGQKRAPGKPFSKGNKWAFKPGQSGNPAGRPKFTTVSEALRKLLEEEIRKGKTGAELLAEELCNIATSGRSDIRIRAIHEIIDRVEGRPKQELEIDVTKLSDAELDQVAAGKKPSNASSVGSASGSGGTGAPSTET